MNTFGLEFRECFCNRQRHFVLYEGKHPYWDSFPLYFVWDAVEQAARYVDEGLLDSVDSEACLKELRADIKKLDLPGYYQGEPLSSGEVQAVYRNHCSVACRYIPEYFIENH
jgi:hypothetical protein